MIIKEPYIYRFKVRTYEADLNNRIKTETIFNFLQEAASGNATQLGFGYEQLMPKGQFWVLSRVIVELTDTVRFDEEIVIETWPKGIDKIFALRDFNIKNSEGQKIGVATTAWLLMDSHRGRPVIFTPENFNLPIYQIPPSINVTPDKIQEPTGLDKAGSIKVSYSDLDVNHHVNNARYLEYVADIFPTDLYRNHFMDFIQVNYLKELKMGDELNLFAKATDDKNHHWYVEGVNQNQIRVFQAILSWKTL